MEGKEVEVSAQPNLKRIIHAVLYEYSSIPPTHKHHFSFVYRSFLPRISILKRSVETDMNFAWSLMYEGGSINHRIEILFTFGASRSRNTTFHYMPINI